MNVPTTTAIDESSPVKTPGIGLKSGFSWNRLREQAIEYLLMACAWVSILTSAAIIFVLLTEAVFGLPPHKAFFQQVSVWEFCTGSEWTPSFTPPSYGILPLICGTMLITVIAGLVGLPCGLMIAVYLSEYATPRARAIFKPTLELLAGVPTIVYGFFALSILTPYFIKPFFEGLLRMPVDGFNALSGGLVVGLMIIPMVASLSEDVLRAVPRTLREAGYALGSTKFDVCVKIVLPSALSGILASFILALSRAVGETMAVTIAAGTRPSLSINPLQPIETLTAYIVNVTEGDLEPGTAEYTSLYAAALVLFVMTMIMNIISQWILSRYREVYQ